LIAADMAVSQATDLLQEALALHRRGALAEAAARYIAVLRADPGNAEAHCYLGMIDCQHGRFAEGAERARQALARDPQNARAHMLLGRALAALGQRDEALASFDAAIALAPDLARAHGQRADLLAELGRNAEAIESYDRALELAPDVVEDWFNRGGALTAVGRYEDAIASFNRAAALNPELAGANVLRAPLFLSKLRICDWANYQGDGAQLLAMIRAEQPLSVPFAALLVPCTPADQLQCARRYVQDHPAPPPLWRGEIFSHERIRVAYLSADFREHATSHLAAGLFERHDRTRFEITALSFGEDDGSATRRRVVAAFERFVDVRHSSDQEIAELMRRLEIDIAVDLMGFTKDHRLGVLARRAAPIQVSYLGYPGTMGTSLLDYIIADSTVIPEEHDACYAERIVRLPGSYQVNDDTRPIAAATPSRRDCGLPDGAFVFCCFNHTQKLNPDVFDIWMRVLRAIDNSVLWLLEGSATSSANLCRAAEQRGVSAQQLIFASKTVLPEHLTRQRLADLFLDTLPYNAHTTASDALWAGLPVLTQIGATFAGRVAASLLRTVGLPELITTTADDYERRAVELANNREMLATIRGKLAASRATTPLFDTALFARRIEAAYAAMHQRHQAGLAPANITIE
jgi:predicted O-linked N-acetylglucosamine transferase (SPINDLY family)